MSDQDAAIVGVQSCGCVTMAIARPGAMRREEERALMEIVREGGSVLHTTVGEARAMDDFLPAQCPHNPKGWPDRGEKG